MNFFVLNGHKYYPFSEGKLNKTLFDEIIKILSSNNQVKTTIIEKGYDINEEIEKFKWADVVIFQSPVNWFSIPWIFKKYIDEIYQYGVFYEAANAYGQGGLMKGKKYMFSMTCNSPKEIFSNPNSFFEGKSVEDMILSLHKTQEFVGMEPLKSYFCFDVVHNPDIPKYIKGLREHLNAHVL